MNRYWVGGSGVWDWGDTSHWSESSGGVGGASVPTEEDDVYIDSNSGFDSGGKITVSHNGSCKDFTCTSGHTYTIQEDSYGSIYVNGSVELESGVTWGSNLGLILSGGGTIKTNGVKLSYINIGIIYA